jgi:hypothetical protein
MRIGISFTVSLADRLRLQAIVAAPRSLQKHVWRARVILLSDDGLGTMAIRAATGKSKTCIWRWQARFMTEGVDGLLRDKTHPPGVAPVAPDRVAEIVRLTQAPPPHEATHWTLRAIKRLNLGRFIDRKHDRVGGRRDIQADNISELLKQGRIVGELELPPAMRAETVRLPNSLHRKSRHTGCLGHRTQRPMRCFMGWWGLCQPHNLSHAIRRDTGRAGLVAKQAIDALRHQPIIAQQNDTSTPDMFLQASGSGNNRV